MTATEILAIGGGLVVGYWIVAVLLPELGRHRDDADDLDGAGRSGDVEADGGGPDGNVPVVVDVQPRDERPVRREM